MTFSSYPHSAKQAGGAVRLKDFEFKVKADGEPGIFSGYGSVFGLVDHDREIVAPGAFSASLAEQKAVGRPVPVLWQHSSSQPIGIYTEIVEDEKGLKVSGKLLVDSVKQAAETYALMQAGAVSGLSIGYMVEESSRDETTGVRTLERLKLLEVSLVTFPANDESRVDEVKFKLAHGRLPNLKDFEKLLREAGFSKTQAACVANNGMRELLQRESGADSDTDSTAIVDRIKSITADFADFKL